MELPETLGDNLVFLFSLFVALNLNQFSTSMNFCLNSYFFDHQNLLPPWNYFLASERSVQLHYQFRHFQFIFAHYRLQSDIPKLVGGFVDSLNTLLSKSFSIFSIFSSKTSSLVSFELLSAKYHGMLLSLVRDYLAGRTFLRFLLTVVHRCCYWAWTRRICLQHRWNADRTNLF